jgi:acetoin utilization deacetylase AcuC-like enzyme
VTRAPGWLTDEAFLAEPDTAMAGFLGAEEHLEPDPMAFDRAASQARARFARLMHASGLEKRCTVLAAEPAADADLLRIHDCAHLEHARRVDVAGGGWVGDHTWLSAGGFATAALAAGSCVAAVRAVLDGRVRNAYALVSPPGHHAHRNRAAGFCVLANAAVAVAYAQSAGVQRVAVVDWDAHHGDGTQAAFWRSPDVVTVSLHQAGPSRPGGAGADAVGEGPGRGANINVPLPAGAGLGAYLYAFDAIVEPALHAHAPELIVVACGLDASTLDPLARLSLHSDAYRALLRRLMAVAAEHSDGRLVLCHEGGYAPAYVPYCGLAIVEELSGARTGVDDPFLRRWQPFARDQLAAHERAAIDEVAVTLAKCYHDV